MVLAVLAAGCTTPDANHQPAVNDQTDVWFAQHMVPHLLQDTAIASLSRDELTDPDLARLADRIHRRSQAHAAQLLEWLAERGLAPHGHSHQRGDTLRRSDLERLSRLDGAALDLAFVKVMTARDRAGGKLAATETRGGSVPAIRQLAQHLLADQQAQIKKMQTWRRRLVTAATAGTDGGETVSALLDKAGRFPILVQHLKSSAMIPQTVVPVTAHTAWGADRSGPGHPEHPIGPVGQRWHLLELLSTDLVAHRHARWARGSILPNALHVQPRLLF